MVLSHGRRYVELSLSSSLSMLLLRWNSYGKKKGGWKGCILTQGVRRLCVCEWKRKRNRKIYRRTRGIALINLPLTMYMVYCVYMSSVAHTPLRPLPSGFYRELFPIDRFFSDAFTHTHTHAQIHNVTDGHGGWQATSKAVKTTIYLLYSVYTTVYTVTTVIV